MKTTSLRFFILLSFWGFGSFTYGQVGTFYKTYLYSGVDKAFDLAPTHDGGYIMTGYFGVGFGTYRVLVIKTDSQGNEEWHKVYGHPMRNDARAIIPLADGGYMVGATTSGDQFSGDFEDIFLLRLDENGDTLWTKTYVQDGIEYLFDMKQCPGGGFIIAGGRLDSIQDYSDGYALKIDDWGNKEWEQSYNIGNDFDIFWDVEILPDSGYVFSGEAEMEPEVARQNWLLRADKDGELIWSKHYGWVHTELSRGGMLIDGDYIITAGGTTSFSGNIQYDALVAKLDMEGDTIWTRVIDGGASEFNIGAITKSLEGNYLLAINDVIENGETEYDVVVTMLSPNNEILWTNSVISGVKSEFTHDIFQNPDGGILVAGETSSDCGGCAFLIKLTEEGFTSDVNTVPIKKGVVSIFPNPSAGLFYIQLPDLFKDYTLLVFNSTGQQVNTYKANNQNGLMTIDLSFLPDGAYFLVLRNKVDRIISSHPLLKITK